jgi:ArsR family transcriptional regulator
LVRRRLLIVDFAPHEREELRESDAHARLGFADAAMTAWLKARDWWLSRASISPAEN